MKSTWVNKVFGVLAMGLLFLSVSCSHNRTTASKLDGLSEEVSMAAEETAPEAKSEDTTEPVKNEEVSVQEVVPQEKVEVAVEAVAPQENAETPATESAPEEVAVQEVAPAANPEAPVQEAAPKETVEAIARVESDFAVPVEENPVSEKQAPVTTLVAKEFAAQAKSDLDSIGEDSSRRKKKKRSRVRGKRDELSRWDELVAAAKLAKNEEAAKQEQQLASPNLSSVIERNLFWVALAIVGGLISVFFTIRRNRKSTDMKL